MFATNNDLHKISPDSFEQGVDDWTTELTMAQEDVINFVKVNFWSNHKSVTSFDETLLTATQWTKATVFRALSSYILPKMATFRIDDTFVEQIKFYKERYAEELELQFALGIEYDLDESGTVEDSEVTTYKQDRLYR